VLAVDYRASCEKIVGVQLGKMGRFMHDVPLARAPLHSTNTVPLTAAQSDHKQGDINEHVYNFLLDIVKKLIFEGLRKLCYSYWFDRGTLRWTWSSYF
jgi:hypothetical protein